MATRSESATRRLPARTRNKRGEGAQLRTMILGAAQALLEESGSEAALSIRAVTRRAGIAPQSFYLQFASLDALLFALYARAFEEFHAALVSAGERTTDPTGRLQSIAEAYVRFALENPGPYRSLMSSRGSLHPDWNPDELPGAETFALLRTRILAVHTALQDDPSALHVKTTLMWAQLHGISILMIDRPTFPWPALDDMILCALS
jgi:AcrR family transcriptional regulator